MIQLAKPVEELSLDEMQQVCLALSSYAIATSEQIEDGLLLDNFADEVYFILTGIMEYAENNFKCVCVN